MDIQSKLTQLEAKVNTLIDLISNKPELQSDAVAIKDFIEKYSIVKEILNGETLTSFETKINELNSIIEEVKEKIEGPLLVAKAQSERLLEVYSSDKVSLALNVSDVKMLKEDLYKTVKDFIKYLNSLDIDTKLNTLKEQIIISKTLNQELIAQKTLIDNLASRLEKDENIINHIQEVNQAQNDLINQTHDLITIIEKQIEDYAFFTNEFNKIYINAKEFMTKFAEALHQLEYITQRDDLLYEFVKKTATLLENDYITLTSEVKALKEKITLTMQELLSWLNHSLMFVNEVRAYNLSLKAYNEAMDNISNRADAVINSLKNITL